MFNEIFKVMPPSIYAGLLCKVKRRQKNGFAVIDIGSEQKKKDAFTGRLINPKVHVSGLEKVSLDLFNS